MTFCSGTKKVSNVNGRVGKELTLTGRIPKVKQGTKQEDETNSTEQL